MDQVIKENFNDILNANLSGMSVRIPPILLPIICASVQEYSDKKHSSLRELTREMVAMLDNVLTDLKDDIPINEFTINQIQLLIERGLKI